MSFTEHKTDEQSNLILALDSLAILETEAKHPWLRDHIDNISKVLVAYGQLLNRVGEIQAKYTAEKGKREYAERFVCCKEVLVFGIHSHDPQGRGSRKEKRMRKSGIAFHCHHDDLAEYVHDYDERVEYIKANKPVEEQELRLRLFKLIPNDMLPPECDKARVEWDKAQAEWDKARAECDKAQAECDKARAERDKARAERDKAQAEWDKARVERDKARVEWDKAWVEWDKAWAEWDRALAKCMPALERLHKKLCPNCPWNGYTIFTRHSPGQGLQKGGG